MSLYNKRLNHIFDHSTEIDIYKLDSIDVDDKGYVELELSHFRFIPSEKRKITTTGFKRLSVQGDSFSFGTKLKRDFFMSKYIDIEVLTIFLLSYRYSNSLEDLDELRRVFAKVTLYERFKLMKLIWKDDFPNHFDDLLSLRNTVMHNDNIEYIRYGDLRYWADEEVFQKKLKAELNKIYLYLAKVFEQLTSKVDMLTAELDKLDKQYMDKKIEKNRENREV